MRGGLDSLPIEGGLGKKERGGVFEGGGRLIPNSYYVLNLVFLLILPSQTYPDVVKVWIHWYMYTLYRSPADHKHDHTCPFYCSLKKSFFITPWWVFVFDLGIFSNKGRVSTPGKSGNLWRNGLVVKALDSQSRGLVFKSTGWLQVRLSLSSFRGW